MYFFFYFTLLLSTATEILEHRFSLNFGEVFYDYSETQHTSINGISPSNTLQNVIPTDRGVYFPLGNSTVTLPPNSLSSTLSLPNTFSIIFWAYILDYTFSILTCKSLTSLLVLQRLSINENLSLQIQTSSFSSTEFVSGTSSYVYGKRYLGSWNLAIVSVSSIIKLTVNKSLYVSYSLTQVLQFGSFTSCNLGVTGSQTSIVGYFYNFIITDTEETFSNYLTDASSSCIVSGCSPCEFAVLDHNASGCLPTILSPYTDSLGNSCSCAGSCSNSICLSCSCQINTCEIYNNQIICKCPQGALYNSTSCYCELGRYLSGGECKTCIQDCLSCSSGGFCDECIASNAKNVTGGCVCLENLYNLTRLSTSNACLQCDSKCKGCDSFGNCTACVDSSADLSRNCDCGAGFYFEGTCRECFVECTECSSYGTCTSCVADNAEPAGFGCDCSLGYGSESVLSSFGACVKCNVSCLSCTNEKTCVVCNDPFAIAPKCECMNGYFLETSLCEKCPNDCKVCNVTGCVECWDLLAQVNGSECFCPNATYKVTSSNYTVCKPCRDDCKTCSDANTCLECLIIGAVPRTIGCSCASGFYSDSTKCAKCENWVNSTETCIFCSARQYFTNDTCMDCPLLCEQCTPTQCTKCVSNAELQNLTCQCKSLYKGIDKCFLKPLDLNITVTSSTTLVFLFSSALITQLQVSDFSVLYNLNNILTEVTSTNTSQYTVYLQEQQNTAQITVIVNFNTSVVSIYNQSLVESVFVVNLPMSAQAQSEQNAKATFESTTKSNLYATFSVTVFLAIVNLNFMPIWSFLNSVQVLIYIRLINITLPARLDVILQALRNCSKIFNVFDYFISPHSFVELTGVWLNFGFESPCLFLNAGHLVTIFFFLLVYMMFVFVCKKLTNFRPFSYEVIKNNIDQQWQSFHYSAFLRYVIQTYLDFGVASLLPVLNMNITAILDVMNLILCLLVAFFICLIPLITVILANKHLNLSKTQAPAFNSKYDSLFYEFNSDSNLATSYFYFFFFAKRFFLILTLFLLHPYTQVQLISNTLTNFTVFPRQLVIYLYKYKPYSEKLITYSNILSEACITTIFLLLSFYESLGSSINTDILDFSFVAMIYLIFLAQTASPFFIFARRLYSVIKEKFSKPPEPVPDLASDRHLIKFVYPKHRVYPWSRNITTK